MTCQRGYFSKPPPPSSLLYFFLCVSIGQQYMNKNIGLYGDVGKVPACACASKKDVPSLDIIPFSFRYSIKKLSPLQLPSLYPYDCRYVTQRRFSFIIRDAEFSCSICQFLLEHEQIASFVWLLFKCIASLDYLLFINSSILEKSSQARF